MKLKQRLPAFDITKFFIGKQWEKLAVGAVRGQGRVGLTRGPTVTRLKPPRPLINAYFITYLIMKAPCLVSCGREVRYSPRGSPLYVKFTTMSVGPGHIPHSSLAHLFLWLGIIFIAQRSVPLGEYPIGESTSCPITADFVSAGINV